MNLPSTSHFSSSVMKACTTRWNYDWNCKLWSVGSRRTSSPVGTLVAGWLTLLAKREGRLANSSNPTCLQKQPLSPTRLHCLQLAIMSPFDHCFDLFHHIASAVARITYLDSLAIVYRTPAATFELNIH